MRILLAGSTGSIGREMARVFRDAGHDVTCPARATGIDALRPESLEGIFAGGYDVCVSAIGGSVALSSPDKRPYAVTNGEANRNLFAAARRAGVRRFVYVAAHSGSGWSHTAYMRAHEDVVQSLDGTSYTALRPTAVFPALRPFLDFARKGVVPLIGDGSAKTNPISAPDVARAALQYLADGPVSVSIGGPDIITRRGIGELAAAAVRKSPLFLPAPAFVARTNGKLIGLFDRRMGELVEFAASVSTVDCVAPAYGQDRLADYFAHFSNS